jgi:ubiquinone/menaquinone biosynthesis C-methylase UbiE
MANARAYDRLSGILLGSLYRSIANDIAATIPPEAVVLEVGCGPGHLSIDLAVDHGLEVTGVDLDPDMIVRAGANAARRASAGGHAPTFVVGDAAALPFPDGSFDVVVSTFSLHHWSDPGSGLTEIARVLRPDGRAVIWDFSAGPSHFHPEVADPEELLHASPFHEVSVQRWHWPGRLSLSQRWELSGPDAPRRGRTPRAK